jgi:hypothetical protein
MTDETVAPTTFAELAASRRAWIDIVLRPWCRQATRKDLQLAELEWTDIAGKVDAAKTLWAWAWSRFPDAVHEELGLDETTELTVTLMNGSTISGFVDARESTNGQLVLWSRDASTSALQSRGPVSIDDIQSIHRAE